MFVYKRFSVGKSLFLRAGELFYRATMSDNTIQITLKTVGKNPMCTHAPKADRREIKPYNLLCFKPRQTAYWLVRPRPPQTLIN